MNGVRQAALFVRTNLWIVPLALLLAWALFRFLDPAPPRHLVMVTGSESGGYHQFGLALKGKLAGQGLTLEVLSTSGSMENLQRLTEGSAEVQLGLIQSGTTRSEEHTSELQSRPHLVCRLLLEKKKKKKKHIRILN